MVNLLFARSDLYHCMGVLGKQREWPFTDFNRVCIIMSFIYKQLDRILHKDNFIGKIIHVALHL